MNTVITLYKISHMFFLPPRGVWQQKNIGKAGSQIHRKLITGSFLPIIKTSHSGGKRAILFFAAVFCFAENGYRENARKLSLITNSCSAKMRKKGAKQ